jgi:hypothetical protein
VEKAYTNSTASCQTVGLQKSKHGNTLHQHACCARIAENGMAHQFSKMWFALLHFSNKYQMRQWIDLVESLQVRPGPGFSTHQFLQTLANFMRRPVNWSWLKDNTYFKRTSAGVEIHAKRGEFDPVVFGSNSMCTLGLNSLEELETWLKQHGVKKRVKKRMNRIIYR